MLKESSLQLRLDFSPLPFDKICMGLTTDGNLTRKWLQMGRKKEIRSPFNIEFPGLQLPQFKGSQIPQNMQN